MSINVSMKFVSALFCGLTVGALAPAADAVTVTIDFGNTHIPNFLPTQTYSEDGFTFTVNSGTEWAIRNAGSGFPVGNPPSGLVAGDAEPNLPGDYISVKEDNGSLFTFDAFDYASFGSSLADSVDFVGLVGGVPTELLADITKSGDDFIVAFNPLFGNPIDELRIVAKTDGATALIMDNFVFTTVSASSSIIPEPATASLGLLALGGLMMRRRRLV